MVTKDRPTEELVEALEQAGLAADLDLLRACLAREEDLRPHLLDMLATAPADRYGLPPDADDPRLLVDLHAGHLLIAFKEPAALPIFAEIFRDEARANLIEWFTPWLHAYRVTAVAPFAAVVEDEEANFYGRAAATELLSAIGRYDPEARGTAIAALEAMLPAPSEDGDLPAAEEREEIWAWIVSALAELRAEETLPHAEALFAAGLLDRDVVGGLEEIRDRYGQNIREPRPFNLLDIYRYLHHLAEQEEARKRAERSAARRRGVVEATTSGEYERRAPGEPTVRVVPKVGRNDPCPCGSGRKYKRCHGRPSR